MAKRPQIQYRRSGAAATTSAGKPRLPFSQRWIGKVLLILLSVLLLGLAYAPFKQFYLAWIGLVPFFVVIANTRTGWRALAWGWTAGILFFSANMWWISCVTGIGAVALMLFLGSYWAVAAVVIRGLDLLPNRTAHPPEASAQSADAQPPAPMRPLSLVSMFAIAAVWVGLEWVRGAYPLEGLPWLNLSHTQTPALVLCQIADVTGDLGVSFWVVLLNALVAGWLLNRFAVRRMIGSTATVVVLTVAVVAYGVYRFRQEAASLSPGPTILLVQPNILQDNTGQKGKPLDEIVKWHLDTTFAALRQPIKPDLIAWSETVMPAINKETLEALKGDDNYGDFAQDVHLALSSVARMSETALITGGSFYGRFEVPPGEKPSIRYRRDSRNAAYYFDRSGRQFPTVYHKIHRVPFGEFIPFKESIPPLYKIFLTFGPPDMDEYQLNPGSPDNMTVFTLSDRAETAGPGKSWRFVTPICFEDVDGPLCAKMFRPGPGAPGVKRADFIVNLTNDGWFRWNQMPQHLQIATFRSIENRVPTARSVNTGVSGFIDSMGRNHDLLPASTEGTVTAPIRIDSRLTFYTVHGAFVGPACGGLTGLMAVAGLIRWWFRRRIVKA